MKRLALLLLFALTATVAHAVPLTFQVDYLTVSTQTCFTVGCFSNLPGTTGTTASKTFVLDSALLATGGTYDVVSSLNPNPIIPITPGPGVTTGSSLTANAIVAGGVVTDLVLHYSQSVRSTNFLGDSSSSWSFNASGGAWSSSQSSISFTFHSSSSDSAAGTYTIRQLAPVEPPPPDTVPEPSSLILLSGGLIACLTLRRR